jgi:hypothetical protein
VQLVGCSAASRLRSSLKTYPLAVGLRNIDIFM